MHRQSGRKWITVLIIDDYPLVRYGLKQMFREELRGVVVGEANSAEQAHVELAKRAWDMLLLNVDLRHPPGLRLLPEILQNYPQAKVLAFGIHRELSYAELVFQTGAIGYIPKSALHSEFIHAFRSVLAGRKYIYPSLSKDPHEQPPHKALSAREGAVMRAIASGKNGNTIAADLNLSIKTISTYKRRILNKLRLRSIADLVRYVVENDL